MTRVYFDANIVVYLVERTPRANLVRQHLLQLPQPQVYTSDLVLCECLVVPLRNNNHALVAAYEQFYAEQSHVPNSYAIFRRAAELRALSNLRTPDALHLAYALSVPCDVFMTSDQRLAQSWTSLQTTYPNLQILVI